eukprot:3935871-Rhodomonas_salina.2
MSAACLFIARQLREYTRMRRSGAVPTRNRPSLSLSFMKLPQKSVPSVSGTVPEPDKTAGKQPAQVSASSSGSTSGAILRAADGPGKDGYYNTEVWSPTAWHDVFVSVHLNELCFIEHHEGSSTHNIRRQQFKDKSEAEDYMPAWNHTMMAYTGVQRWKRKEKEAAQAMLTQDPCATQPRMPSASPPILSQESCSSEKSDDVAHALRAALKP